VCEIEQTTAPDTGTLVHLPELYPLKEGNHVLWRTEFSSQAEPGSHSRFNMPEVLFNGCFSKK
jgi:hypothetical protein